MAESGKNVSVVVWEWLNDYGHWRPFEPNVVDFIEKNTNSSTPVPLGNADRTLSNYVLDTRKMEQIRLDSGNARKVRRKIYPPQSPPAIGVTWQWQGDRGEWHHYNIDVACLLENSLNKKVKTIDLSRTIYALPYTVDLVNLTQRRNETGYLRNIQRNVMMRYPPAGDMLPPEADTDLLLPESSRKHAHSDTSIDSGNSPNSKIKPSKKKNRSTVAPKDTRPSSGRSLTRTFLSKSKSSDSVSATLSQAPFMHSSQSTVFAAGATAIGCLTPPTTLPVNQVKGSVVISPVMTGVTNMLLTPIVPIVLSQNIVINPPANESGTKPKKKERKSKKKDKKDGIEDSESVMRKYTEEVEPPTTDDDCCICCEQLQASAGFASEAAHPVILKLRCDHMFHRSCLCAMYDSGTKDGSLQCPTCKTIYGEKFGNCPAGRMEIHTIPDSLPGETCDTIRIIYHIPPGIQGSNHPHPGRVFTSRGFPRYCYLPNTEKGRKAMLLLKIAWERRLTFTIGISATTGEHDTVTWNEIHHKTEFGSNRTGHGFPDPNYLDNVLAELAAQGVSL